MKCYGCKLTNARVEMKKHENAYTRSTVNVLNSRLRKYLRDLQDPSLRSRLAPHLCSEHVRNFQLQGIFESFFWAPGRGGRR